MPTPEQYEQEIKELERQIRGLQDREAGLLAERDRYKADAEWYCNQLAIQPNCPDLDNSICPPGNPDNISMESLCHQCWQAAREKAREADVG